MPRHRNDGRDDLVKGQRTIILANQLPLAAMEERSKEEEEEDFKCYFRNSSHSVTVICLL